MVRSHDQYEQERPDYLQRLFHIVLLYLSRSELYIN